MLNKFGTAFTPLHWLLFVLSDEGHVHIGKVLDRFKNERLGVSDHLVNSLLEKVTDIVKHVPVLAVDELQHFSTRQVNNPDGTQLSLMKAVVQAAQLLSCSAVWSGTRMRITAPGTPLGNIAKLFGAERQIELTVLGDFEYLTSEKVIAYFTDIITTTASEATMLQLGYFLQGRPRVLASFVAYLLIPDGRAMQNRELTDEVLRAELENYMNKYVVSTFEEEIDALVSKGLLSTETLGYMWCNSMLRNAFDGEKCEKLCGVAERSNSLAFTKHVVRVENDSAEDEFTHVFGEPGLQEALLRLVWGTKKYPDLVDKGMLQLLSGAYTRPILDCCVALALLSRRATVLSDLCSEHPKFKRFAGYQLHINRIVLIERAEDQLEWLQRLLADPDDCEFSLLKGVPVKNIALLPSENSGADFLFVGVRVDGAAAAAAVAELESVVTHYTLPAVSRKRTRAAINEADATAEAEVAADGTTAAPLTQIDHLVLVNVSCATNKNGVTNAQHDDSIISLSGHQFLKSKCIKGGKFGNEYNQLSKKYTLNYLPIIVEIPRKADLVVSDSYVHISEKEATKLFSLQVVEAFISRSSTL